MKDKKDFGSLPDGGTQRSFYMVLQSFYCGS